MPAEQLPFRRRIYASVDVIGSTSLKQGSHMDKQWPDKFRQFFDDFPECLEVSFNSIANVPNGKPAKPMEVWKFVGDEILFQAELSRHQEVAFHVLAFMGALRDFSLDARGSKAREGFAALKGTMWGAGFPVSNTEVNPRFSPTLETDYIGPCIDQGFRLCALSDTRKLTVSVDIAYMLSLAKVNGAPGIRIFCEEPKQHKGVAFHYPHIWVDRMDNTMAEDGILGRAVCEPSQLTKYIEELYGKTHGGLFAPFIEGDPDETFGHIPDDFIKARLQLVSAEIDEDEMVGDPDYAQQSEDSVDESVPTEPAT